MEKKNDNQSSKPVWKQIDQEKDWRKGMEDQVKTLSKSVATKRDVETTIEKAVDTMADMIGKGFAHNDTRFDAIESRLDRIETYSWKSSGAKSRIWKPA